MCGGNLLAVGKILRPGDGSHDGRRRLQRFSEVKVEDRHGSIDSELWHGAFSPHLGHNRGWVGAPIKHELPPRDILNKT